MTIRGQCKQAGTTKLTDLVGYLEDLVQNERKQSHQKRFSSKLCEKLSGIFDLQFVKQFYVLAEHHPALPNISDLCHYGFLPAG